MKVRLLRVGPLPRRGNRALAAIAFVSLLGLAAAPAHLVKDISTTPESYISAYVTMTAAGSRLVFTFDGQLWSSDGTSAGTGVVPGTAFTNTPYFLGSSDGVAYMQAGDEQHGSELWRTDGTFDGTRLVSDLNPGYPGSWIGELVPFGGKLYFGAAFGSAPAALWKTDGTAAGTARAAGLGPVVGFPGRMVALNDQLLFIGPSTRQPTKPYALYVTDGTDSGTSLLQEFAPHYFGTVCPGPCPTTGPWGLMVMDGIAYFAGNDGESGLELWRTDGTPQGTRLVRDICPGNCYGLSQFEGFQVVDHRLYFFGTDPTHGQELWSSDGTLAGTQLVRDIEPGPGNGAGSLWYSGSGIAPLASSVFFPGYDSVRGAQLWRSDGTESGTTSVSSFPKGDSYPGQVARIGDGVYFLMSSTRGAAQLWKVDGDGSGVRLVADLGSSPYGLIEAGGAVYFSAVSQQGVSLWKTDGTAAGTAPLALLKSTASTASSSLKFLGDRGGNLVFAAGGVYGPRTLWKSDGTEVGTSAVSDVTVGEPFSDSQPSSILFRGDIFFAGSDAVHGSQLWRTDATGQGTRPVPTLDRPLSSRVCGLSVVGEELYFGELYSRALWRTDGSAAALVDQIEVVCGPSPAFVPLNGFVFFGGNLSYSDYGLFRTDGTGGGTQKIWSGGLGSKILYNGRLIYDGYIAGNASLWVTEGEPGSTVLLGPTGESFALAGSDIGVFALVRSYRYGSQLWKTDGTASGTVLLASWDQQTFSDLVAIGARVFFSAHTAEHGTELWMSDGTPQGTRIVLDIAKGPADSSPRNLTVIDGILIFTARDAAHGEELWRSDGTEQGTFRLQDINPGPRSSLPEGFTKAGSFLYFSADDGEHGRELWAMPLSALSPSPSGRPREPRVVHSRQ